MIVDFHDNRRGNPRFPRMITEGLAQGMTGYIMPKAKGICGGVGNNMFSPQGSYTREQSIITLLRLFDLAE